MNTGLLIWRILLGLLVAAHGTQKPTRHLDDGGSPARSRTSRTTGFGGSLLTALAAGTTQVGAGLLMAAGFLTSIASTGIIGVILVAASTKLGHGPWAQHDGYEYPLPLATPNG